MTAQLEHANITVSDPTATAKWMQSVFGWHTRWSGEAINGGFTIHVGSNTSYLAIYNPGGPVEKASSSYAMGGGLNHLAVTVSDIQETRKAVIDAGFKPGEQYDYEPGLRFYFRDSDNIEYEVVQYD